MKPASYDAGVSAFIAAANPSVRVPALLLPTAALGVQSAAMAVQPVLPAADAQSVPSQQHAAPTKESSASSLLGGHVNVKRSGTRSELLKLMRGRSVEVDKKPTTIVMVLPRGQLKRNAWSPSASPRPKEWSVKCHRTWVPLDETVQDPIGKAERIFLAGPGQLNEGHLAGAKAFEKLRGDEEVTQHEYMEAVREHLITRIKQAGLQTDFHHSIDDDEVFLKISLDRRGGRIKELAEMYQYRMPLSYQRSPRKSCMGQAEEEDKNMEEEGYYQEEESESEEESNNENEQSRPMLGAGGRVGDSRKVWTCQKNRFGQHVPGYRVYTKSYAKYLSSFRQVDEIRLIHKCLLGLLSLQELSDQHILTRCFPAADYYMQQRLNKTWAAKHIWSPPLEMDIRTLGNIRNYFGEMVAFFFFWFGFYIRYMLYLASAALLVGLLICLERRFHFMADLLISEQVLQFGFAVFLIVWASMFNKVFTRKAVRLNQKWGMKRENSSMQRGEYSPELEGSPAVRRNRRTTRACTIGYCLAFVGIVVMLEFACLDEVASGATLIRSCKSVILAAIIKVSSFVWGKVAIRLVQRENHRNQRRFNRSLAWTLSAGKLFTALWPFAYTAFAANWLNQRCSSNFGKAVMQLYSADGWPDHSLRDKVPLGANVTPEQLPFLEGYYTAANETGEFFHDLYYKTIGKGNATTYCIWGCYPVECGMGRTCEDNCLRSLGNDLLTYYLIDVVCRVVFDLLIPVYLTRRKVEHEIKKVERSSGSPSIQYNFVEFQSKCHEVARYEYDSWGGSHTQDFLQLVVGYTLMACFSQVQPAMAIIGIFGLSIEYKILAFRMVNVNGRPWPLYGQGIGVWQDILNMASGLAVSVNVALAVFKMMPVLQLGVRMQLLIFIVAEKVLLSLRYTATQYVETQPDDVRRIEDYNAEFETSMTRNIEGQEASGCKRGEVGEVLRTAIALGEQPSSSSDSEDSSGTSD